MASDVGFSRPAAGESTSDQQRVMAEVVCLLAKQMDKDALCAVTSSNSSAFHVLASRGYGIVLEELLKAVSDPMERTLSSEELLEICHELNANDCTVLDCAYLSAKHLTPVLERYGMRRNPLRAAAASGQGANRQNMMRRLDGGGGPPSTTNQGGDRRRWARQGLAWS